MSRKFQLRSCTDGRQSNLFAQIAPTSVLLHEGESTGVIQAFQFEIQPKGGRQGASKLPQQAAASNFAQASAAAPLPQWGPSCGAVAAFELRNAVTLHISVYTPACSYCLTFAWRDDELRLQKRWKMNVCGTAGFQDQISHLKL